MLGSFCRLENLEYIEHRLCERTDNSRDSYNAVIFVRCISVNNVPTWQLTHDACHLNDIVPDDAVL